jgi:hypothetical protein
VRTEIEIMVRAVRGPEVPPGLEGLNWPKLFRLAAANKVLWPLVERLAGDWRDAADVPPRLLEDAVSQGFSARARVRRTIEFVRTAFDQEGILWRVLKTARDIDNIPTDVDLVVPAYQFREAHGLLERDPRVHTSRLGLRRGSDIMGEDKVSFAPSAQDAEGGLTKIDLHRSLDWHGRQCVATELALSGSHTGQVAGLPVPVPLVEIELLATAASLLFDRRSVPLADLLWIERTLYQTLDWGLVSAEVERWGWTREFASFLSLAAALAENVVGQPPPLAAFVTQNASPVAKRARRETLPMPFPLGVRHDLRLLAQGLLHAPATALAAFGWHRYRALRERLTRGRVTGFGSWYHPGR